MYLTHAKLGTPKSAPNTSSMFYVRRYSIECNLYYSLFSVKLGEILWTRTTKNMGKLKKTVLPLKFYALGGNLLTTTRVLRKCGNATPSSPFLGGENSAFCPLGP